MTTLIQDMPIGDTTLITPNPAWQQALRETGIVPEHIYARCSSLVQFTWNSTPVRRNVTLAPKVGAKPTMRKRKTKR